MRKRPRSPLPEYYRDRRKTIQGLLSQAYDNMRRRCLGRKPGKEHIFKGLFVPKRDKFIEWARSDAGFLLCYRQWAESNYDKRLTPSVTRINRARGYSLDNIEFLAHSSNSVLADATRHRRSNIKVIRRLLNV